MKPSMLGLLIAAGAFGASTIYLGVQLDEERDRADQYLEESHALNARIAELEKARAELEALQLATATQPERETAAPASKPAPAPVGHLAQAATTTSEEAPSRSGDREMRGPPERSEAFQKMMRAQIRGNNKRLYSDIGTRLGLSAEEANKLIDLLTDQQVSTMDRMRQQRGAGNPEDRATAMERIQRENQAQVQQLIGADKMELYKSYQETLPARQEVEMLSRQLEGNDASLSKDQRDRMITALAEERSRVPAPKLAESGSREEYQQAMTAWQKYYNERSNTRARSILTSDQIKAYDEYQQWSLEMRQQNESRRRTRPVQ
jgi:hypothetical protein